MHLNKLKQECYRHLLLIVICIFNPFFSNNLFSSDSWIIKEKNMSKCLVSSYDPDIDEYAYIMGSEKIEEDSVSVYINSDILLATFPKCTCETDKKMLRNKIKTNNDSILLKDEMHNIYVSRLIPGNFLLLQNGNQKYYVVELSNISWTTAKGGEIYIIMKLDESEKIQDYFSFRYSEGGRISHQQLIERIEKKYPDVVAE